MDMGDCDQMALTVFNSCPIRCATGYIGDWGSGEINQGDLFTS
jgi:hypothetical protein